LAIFLGFFTNFYRTKTIVAIRLCASDISFVVSKLRNNWVFSSNPRPGVLKHFSVFRICALARLHSPKAKCMPVYYKIAIIFSVKGTNLGYKMNKSGLILPWLPEAL
jgi:hypothetical protein